MKSNITHFLACVCLLFVSSIDGKGQISLLKDYRNNFSPPIGTYQGINFREAGFSGLYPIPNTNGKEFWTVSDRGVNIDAANANPASCRPTYDKIYAFPSYAPKIHRIRINGDSIQILKTIALKRPNGTNASGIINPTGFGSTASEVASIDTVLDCANFNSKITDKDIWGIDSEGIVVDKEGNFWICEEGGPTIWKVNANGVVQKRYTPYAALPGAEAQDVAIDTVFKYRKNNRGFEGIAITPSGKIYAIIQSPILYPNKTIGEGTRVHRILEIDPATNEMKMYAYLNDGIIGASGSNQIRLRDWKIGDMVAINDNEFLVIEAAARGTSDIKRIYRINIAQATPITSDLYNGKTLEAWVDAAGLASVNVVPVTKTLVMDLLANGWPSELDKAEGLAILNDSTIAVGNDNDYGQYSVFENGIATATDKVSHLITFRLSGSYKLSGYQLPNYSLVFGQTGPSTSHTPYLEPVASDAKFTSILTVGDAVNGYTMCGIPDGLGAYDNGDGTFIVLMNHELGSSAGVVRAHGSKGAFVSKWVINKSDLSVVSGSDLIHNVNLWNGTGYTMYNAANPSSLTAFGRFCSADLPVVSAYYNVATGKGTMERIFMNGEESGAEGRMFGNISTGVNAGTTYELPRLGKFSAENVVAHPNAGDNTIVVGMDDATPGQVYVYVGTKTTTGTEIEKAGLTNGKLYGVKVTGMIAETSGSIPAAGTTFSLHDLGNVENTTGTALNTASDVAGVTNFLRPEDGSWDPTSPNDFYFVTTNSFSNPSRLWRLRFTDINNPALGGTIEAVLDGTEGQKMMDNMTIDNSGHVILQEDVGNNVHNGKIWQYTIATDELEQLAQHDASRFINGGANFLTQDEEASGVIDVQSILGPGMFLAVDQAHYSLPGELVEGGQMLAFYNPETANSNPEIVVEGNSVNIVNGSTTVSAANNTSFGSVNVNESVIKSFVVKNSGAGVLKVSGVSFMGANASEFSLEGAPVFPMNIASNETMTLQVKFMPVALGTRTATLVLNNNDYDEGTFTFALKGSSTDQETGPSSSNTPYLEPIASDVEFTSILTVGDAVNGYTMCGIPDGLGAYDNGDGTFTVLMNHELGSSAGVVRAHGSKGAFVSKWVINKSDLSVVSGSDLIHNVNLWNGTGYTMYNAANPSSLTAFGRFCSADLPVVSAYYNAATGKGTMERIFMNGEESGAEGRMFGHISTGVNAGTTYELPRLGKFSAENVVAHPNAGDNTIVVGMDDATPGQVYVYVGTKTSTGTEIEKAGLTNGKLYGVKVTGMIAETSGSIPAAGTTFSLYDLGNVENTTGTALNTASDAAGVTNFLRPEDGSWDPTSPNDFYFVTTNSFSNPSRLWRLRFTDINNPALGGTIEAMLDGTEGQKMMDNMTIDNSGHVILQEDVGNNVHNGKIWQYTIATDELEQLAQHDASRFINGGANFLTQDEEASGVIDVQSILGPGMFLVVDQAHYSIPGELVEGGQMLAFYNPETANSNPEIAVEGNTVNIPNNKSTVSTSDNTDFGSVNKGSDETKTFVISNSGLGALKVLSIELNGVDASEFALVNLPALPLNIQAGSSQTITVKFAPTAEGIRTAGLKVTTNDLDEANYQFKIQGEGLTPTGVTASISTAKAIELYSNPASDYLTLSLLMNQEENVIIKVLNLNGVEMMTPIKKTVVAGQNQIQLHTSELESGTYTVQVISPNGMVSLKAVVVH